MDKKKSLKDLLAGVLALCFCSAPAFAVPDAAVTAGFGKRRSCICRSGDGSNPRKKAGDPPRICPGNACPP